MSAPVTLSDKNPSSKSRTQGFVTKRPHRKSRAGCQGCKRRKIKCDECRPQCTYCKLHRVQCIYDSAAAIPGSSIEPSDDLPMITNESRSLSRSFRDIERAARLSGSPSPSLTLFSSWNPNDVRLLHHYSTIASNTFYGKTAGAERILQFDIPQLAFEHQFIMHCLLGFASLHLHHLAPDEPQHRFITINHRFNALSGLRREISQLSKESYRAVLAGSLFVMILSSDISAAEDGGELWIGNWLGLWAGMRRLISVASWEYLLQSGLAPIFAKDFNPRATLSNLPTVLLDMLSSMDPDQEDTRIISNTLECLSRLYEYLLSNNFTSEFTTRVTAWPANTRIAEFAALAKRRQPQALVIAAYYLVFTKIAEGIWWMAKTSSREIKVIAQVLPVEYQYLMIIPLQAAHLFDKQEIVSLLLSQLPGGSFPTRFLSLT